MLRRFCALGHSLGFGVLAYIALGGQISQALNSAQDFGIVSLQSPAAARVVTFQAATATPTVQVHFGIDFSLAQTSCSPVNTGFSCSTTINFSPQFAGLRQDALTATDQGGNLTAVVLLRGVGLGPELAVRTQVWQQAFASSLSLLNPQGIVADTAGNVYIADAVEDVVLKVTIASGAVATVAGNGTAGYSGDGGPATNAQLSAPLGLAVDGSGNLYVADSGNNVIRKIDAFSQTISTYAGNIAGTSLGDGGVATSAGLSYPTDVAVDGWGNVYIADQYHNRVREVTLSGTITTVAGGGTPGPGSDGIGNGGPAVNAILSRPSSIAVDGAGNLFIAELGSNLIREVSAAIIHVAAGNGSAGYSGDGGSATNASLNSPSAIRVDAGGRLYIADSGNAVVRTVDAQGIIRTLAPGVLSVPSAITVDPSGAIYAADTGKSEIFTLAAQTEVLSFPTTAIASTSFPQKLVFANVGDAPLMLPSFSISGNFNQEASGDSDCVASSSVAGGMDCLALIDFTPSSAGTRTGALSFKTNALNRSSPLQLVALTGTGMGSGSVALNVSSTNVVFGSQPVGVRSAIQTVTVTNQSGATVTLSISRSGAPDFVLVSNSCGTPLPSAAACSLSVAITPSSTGAKTASIFFSAASQAGSNTTWQANVFLSAIGTLQSLTVSPGSMAFGSQPVGSTSTRTFTISNPDAVDISLSSMTISGSGDFGLLSTTCGTDLSAGSTCTITLNYSPSQPGSEAATLNFGVTELRTIQTIGLSGYGIDSSTALAFVPIPPCRVLDTRNANGMFGGPSLTGGAVRTFEIREGNCNIPEAAAAYAMNVAVVPPGGLGYLTVWPRGQAQPYVSTINSDGRVKSGAAIVTAGVDGDLNVFATNPTDFIVDINGYFVPEDSGLGLNFFPLAPCRILDTRNGTGALGGPAFTGTRTFPILSSNCGIPSSAQAYSFNLAAVPDGALSYLTLWPAGQSQPLVSALNAPTGTVVANAVLAMAGANGDVSIFATQTTDLVIDTNGYFARPSAGGSAFHAIQPCRILDTRTLAGGQPLLGTLTVTAPQGNCSVPASATAYVVNATAVPLGFLGYLTLWPANSAQPYVSTLNALDSAVTSNLAIVPAQNGMFNAYAPSPTHLVIDLFGYFQ